MKKLELDQKAICTLIPHVGNMCLLENVCLWEEQQLIVETSTHTHSDNPLRSYNEAIDINGVSSINGIEYAAQAMAVHAALLKESKYGTDTKARGGFLATVKNVEVLSEYLYRDDEASNKQNLNDRLKITVSMLMFTPDGYTYDFLVNRNLDSVTTNCLKGRITIILDNS